MIREVLQSGLFEFKPHEIKALIKRKEGVSPVKRAKLVPAIQSENKIELLSNTYEASDCSQLFDLSLRDLGLSSPKVVGSFNEFSFVETFWAEQNYFDDLLIKIKAKMKYNTPKHPLEILSFLQNEENHRELVFDFVFEYTKLFLVRRLALITQSCLKLADLNVSKQVKRIIEIEYTIKDVVYLLNKSYINTIADRSFVLVHLKLIFVRMAFIFNKPKLILRVFRQIKGELFHKSIPKKPTVCKHEHQLERNRSVFATRKYSPLSKSRQEVICKPISVLSNDKVDLNEEHQLKWVKTQDVTPSLTPNHKNKANVHENNQCIEIFNGHDSFVSTITSSMLLESPIKDCCIKPNTPLDNVKKEGNIIKEVKGTIDKNSCTLSNSTVQHNKLSPIQDFVNNTSLDLALIIIEDLKIRSPPKLKSELK